MNEPLTRARQIARIRPRLRRADPRRRNRRARPARYQPRRRSLWHPPHRDRWPLCRCRGHTGPLTDPRAARRRRVPGALTPVHDLAALLGYAGGGGRWMILSAARDVALSFDTFNDHFRIGAKSLAGQQGTAATRHVGEVAHAGSRPLPLISIPSVVAAITARATGRISRKEHRPCCATGRSAGKSASASAP